MTPNRTLSYHEKRALARLKLAVFAATLILILHALPGKWVREAYPITRWHMFSGVEQLPQGLRRIQYRVIDQAGTAHVMQAIDLFMDAGIGGPEAIGMALGEFAASNDDPLVRQQHRHILANRMEELLRTELSQVEIWEMIYIVNIDTLPHIDYQNPARRTLLASFTPEDTL